MQIICCVCLKTKDKNGWAQASIRNAKEISHGYCPDCYREMMHHLRCRIFNKKQDKNLVLSY